MLTIRILTHEVYNCIQDEPMIPNLIKNDVILHYNQYVRP